MRDTKLIQSVLGTLQEFRKESNNRFDTLEKKVSKIDEKVDRLTESLRYLEDDTPSSRDFMKLEKRVSRLEKHIASS